MRKYQMEINNDKKYLAALSSFTKFGPVRLKRLRRHFSGYEPAFYASAKELKSAGLEENIADEFAAARQNISPDEIISRLEKENIKIVSQNDDDYPKLLSQIYDPPALLYCRGEIKSEELTVAVVGTRKITAYGQQATEKIAGELARNGVTIVSGLAFGVDTAAHQAALRARGRTVAVLATGLDRQSIYPGANRYLAEKIIAEGGCCLSEFPLGTQPLKFNFPQRNRIISGLSLGIVVVEAGEKSGALITARSGLDQNREVFAVPGSIYSPVSQGPNLLIRQGATPVSGAAEIMETLDLSMATAYIENKKILPENKEEREILSALSREPVYIDDLIRRCNLNAPIVNSTLIIMEMKGMVKNLGGMKYVLGR